jgi:selenocysteine lyase/cysteine desulfurase
LAALTGPNHFFIPADDLPYKFEPGGANHESCAGFLGLGDYLRFLTGTEATGSCDREVIEQAFARMQAWEEPLITRLLDYLNNRNDVRVVGPRDAGLDRVGTISFLHQSKSSREITAAVDRTDVAIRHGHMYAWHLCEAMDLDPEDGVVRVSLVHYNTLEEIDRLVEVFDQVI